MADLGIMDQNQVDALANAISQSITNYLSSGNNNPTPRIYSPSGNVTQGENRSRNTSRNTYGTNRSDFNRGLNDTNLRTRINNSRNNIPEWDFKHIAKVMDKFTDGLEKGLMDAVGVNTWKKQVTQGLNAFAKSLGVSLQDLPTKLGENYMKNFMASHQKLGKFVFGDGLKNPNVKQGMINAVGKDSRAGQILSGKIEGSLTSAESMTALKGAIGAISTSLPSLIPVIGAIAVIGIALKDVLDPLVDAFRGLGKVISAASRDEATRKRNNELAQKRLKADVESLITAPFTILKESAQKVEQAWDSALKVISATQGYSKSGVQDLMANFAERLRQEGLTNVIAGTDIISGLQKVIEAGLSGTIAEEFAYQAVKYGAMVPTQDFFGFASTYSSIAANAIKDGKSQSEAIELANRSLSEFTDSLLYASRNIAGGYSTGLTNASELYSQSVKIAQAARIGDASNIADVLTSVSAIIGATAPDLASSMVDAVIKAATGGNADSLVALRSLAGGNASNTEFLKALATNPQKVFTTLFTTLSRMFNDTTGAYMEKAEGYAELFGLSAEAFQRIDFQYLASSIASMKSDGAALSQNLKMLQSGETTLTSEQQRIKQINEYMLEEGLAYVLDNEVARSIQEHMWEEQLTRELQDTTFAVELQGGALQFLSGISAAFKNLLKFFKIGQKTSNVVATQMEAEALESDLVSVLKTGVVGRGKSSILKEYTTRNKDLGLTESYLKMIGSYSEYEEAKDLRKTLNRAYGGLATLGSNTKLGKTLGAINYGLASAITKSPTLASMASELDPYGNNSVLRRIKDTVSNNKIKSSYSWGIGTSKSQAKALATLLQASAGNTTEQRATNTNSGTKTVANRLSQLLTADAIKSMIESGGNYESFLKSGSKYGIANMKEALESSGYNLSDVQQAFEAAYADVKIAEQDKANAEFKALQEDYYKTGTPLFKMLTDTNFFDKILSSTKVITDYLKSFSDYFIKHTTYNQAYTYSAVEELQRQEREAQGDAIYALANSLTSNMTDLKDPTVQTNALLSQILLVASAILQQNNSVNLTLPETLNGLAIGSTRPT